VIGEKITRYLVFETHLSAVNCFMTLTGREPGPYAPEDYFYTADIYREPKGEIVGNPIETDWVLTYLEKTKK
jgi:hypothetical protein